MKANSFFTLLLSGTAITALMTFSTGCSKSDDPVVEPNTIVKVAVDNGFSTLVSAVKTAGLEATLKGPGPFTVFAPTNAAFSAITVPTDPNVLKNILLYHTLGAKVEAAQVNETPLTYGVLTANGTDSVYVKRAGSNVFINGVKVDIANVQAVNGVVHAIGTVLLPPTGNIVQVAQGGYDSLVVAVLYASAPGAGSEDLATALTNIKGATVFAPTNQAFRDLLAAQSPALTRINQLPKSLVVSVLKNHVLGARFFSTDIPAGSTTVPALAGTITLNNSGSGVTAKGAGGAAANVTKVNIVAKNGCVIHEINKVLLP
jgi:uncharacterized surface protein with fasciclin (FAS1) repeats